MKVLIVIDMQNDFTTGVLGNPQTAAVTANVVKKINEFRKSEKDGRIIATLDTHTEDYMNTQEGKNLPVVHCVRGTDGWKLDERIEAVRAEGDIMVEKPAFGSAELPAVIRKAAGGKDIEEIEFIGVCTDICVISNAMIVKAAFPEVPIVINSECCAGVTPQSHENALSAMAVCQMKIERNEA